MATFEVFAQQTDGIKSIDGLKAALSSTLRDEGYANNILTSLTPGSVGNVAWFEFPEGYTETYLSENWQAVDPILQCSLRAKKAFYWDSSVRASKLSRDAKSFLHQCKDMGVHSGIVFPMFGPEQRCDVLSISKRDDLEVDPKRTPIMQAICTHAWLTYLELINDGASAIDDQPLTKRECELLLWLKVGKSNDQIATIMNISDATVQFHISNAMNKLGASNRISAVVMALQRGLIRL
ncbi:MAG: LuxR C-terminal-related transcriptional regulator [Hyphomicrobium sp.]|nr:LuxR family transcriptional regulator [Hyphomicrobium sp.]